jgi:hypothetical protein
MSEKNFDFNEFIIDSRKSLENPKAFFSTLSTSGGFVEPLIKAVIYGLVAGIINYLWVLFGMHALGAGFWGFAVGPFAVVGSVIGAIIGLFIGGAILLIISAICEGNTDYEANVRVAASLMIMMPIGALFNFFYGIMFALASLASLAVSVYGLWMMLNALVQTLKAKEASAKIVFYVLLGLSVLGTIIGIISRAFIRQVEVNQWF